MKKMCEVLAVEWEAEAAWRMAAKAEDEAWMAWLMALQALERNQKQQKV